MDKSTSRREACHQEISAFQRFYPNGLPVRAIGYEPSKRFFAKRTFSRLSFMFVFAGIGEFRRGATVLPINGPAVIVGYPGEYVEYGPTDNNPWEILYVNFVSDLAKVFESRRMLTDPQRVWPIHDIVALRRRALEVLDALKDVTTYGTADRIDRLCENIILESIISAASPPMDDRDRAITRVRGYFEQHYREPIDIDDVALEHGFSPSGFRRRWNALMHITPGNFIIRRRIQEACRLLAESDAGIGEISAAVGYQDPLYFSRIFRKVMGETASSFRRNTLSGSGAEDN